MDPPCERTLRGRILSQHEKIEFQNLTLTNLLQHGHHELSRVTVISNLHDIFWIASQKQKNSSAFNWYAFAFCCYITCIATFYCI
eukprot:c25326_g2_i2 orf=105-359(+)